MQALSLEKFIEVHVFRYIKYTASDLTDPVLLEASLFEPAISYRDICLAYSPGSVMRS